MKKYKIVVIILTALLAIPALMAFNAQADDKPIQAAELPAEATAFIKNFALWKI